MEVEMLLVVEHCLGRHWHLHWEVDGDVNGHLALHEALYVMWNWDEPLHEALHNVWNGDMDQAIDRHWHRHLDGRGHRAIHNHYLLHVHRRM